MSDKTVVEKLLLKPGETLLLVGAPEGYENGIGGLPAGAQVVRQANGPVDAVQVFVRSKAELASALPPARQMVKPGGIIWITYPRGGARVGTDVNRDIIWALVDGMGMTLVANFSVDAIWSALRAKVV